MKYIVYHAMPMFVPHAQHVAVALVEARDVEQVFAMTNTNETDWTENAGVELTAFIAEGFRSTSVGDWIQEYKTGAIWEVAPSGFKQIKPAGPISFKTWFQRRGYQG